MAFSLTLPCGFYCLLAMTQPTNFILISTAVFIEQFGYGFGFSAYMLFLIYLVEVKVKPRIMRFVLHLWHWA